MTSVTPLSDFMSSSSNNSNNNTTQQEQQQEWPTDVSAYDLIGKIGQGAFATVWKASRKQLRQNTNDVDNDPNNNNDDNNNQNSSNNQNQNNNQNGSTIPQQRDQIQGQPQDQVSYDCAIKVLNLDHVDTNLSEMRLEVQAMRLLSHANVLTCLTAFIVDRYLWVVTPLCRKGSSLHCLQTARRVIRQQQKQLQSTEPNPSTIQYPSMEPYIFYIVHETLLGLKYIHENGQIHRDIKAGNILLDDSGIIKIADFGVSGWLIQGGKQENKAKTFVGTPCWMAPEVMEQIYGYDYKADIWSLGITALELARGYAPYAKYPPMKVLILTIQDEPPSLDSYLDDYSPHPDDIDDMIDEKNTYYSNDDLSIMFASQEKYTKHFFEMFVSLCLQKNPLRRPNCSELLSSKYFAQYSTDPHYRQAQRQALIQQVCNLVPDVGANLTSTDQQKLQQKASNNPMPGNTPISILLSAATDDRAAGTTWIFPDGSSQVFSSSSSYYNNSSSSATNATAMSSPKSGGVDVEDVFAALDEFEKQTGGENYNDRTIRTGTHAAVNSPQQQQQQQGQEGQQQQIQEPEASQNYEISSPDELNPNPHYAVVIGSPIVQQPPPIDDDLDDFMNEFEQTTSGEDFRRVENNASQKGSDG